ncbi:MAG: NAD(P)-dependent oxidoreductase [Verrucomicrobiales bacterium]|nr:NAD(P)-dependent oxidoreductase [Verrucomicrobiales bacterium]
MQTNSGDSGGGPRVCALTGGSGYVGSRLAAALQRAGWEVVHWTRRVGPAGRTVSFRLGEEVEAAKLAGVEALIHCAYDFGLHRWRDIYAVNVVGSERLLAAARQAQVRRIICISTISAFPGCRALYGRAKLAMERAAQSVGAVIIRPGLVYGERPGGVFGKLLEQARSARVVPLIRGGLQTQYLLHEDDLATVILRCLEESFVPPTEPITVAHEQGWELRDILTQLAAAQNRRLRFVPVPWQLVWVALKSLELLGLRPPFRSDSLISMVYQNPRPDFTLARSLGFRCRPFTVTPQMVGVSGAGR